MLVRVPLLTSLSSSSSSHSRPAFMLNFRIVLLLFLFLSTCTFFFSSFAAVAPHNPEQTKLCADEKCQTTLFPTHFTREHKLQHPYFLQGDQNLSINVFAVNFSHRPDMMEAVSMDGKSRGYIYNTFIDQVPYVMFLASALKTNNTLYMVDQNNGKLIRELPANPTLLVHYKAYARRLQDEGVYEINEGLINAIEQQQQQQQEAAKKRHSHHHGHGHSHFHGSHDHDDDDGHDHGEKVEAAKELKPAEHANAQETGTSPEQTANLPNSSGPEQQNQMPVSQKQQEQPPANTNNNSGPPTSPPPPPLPTVAAPPPSNQEAMVESGKTEEVKQATTQQDIKSNVPVGSEPMVKTINIEEGKVADKVEVNSKLANELNRQAAMPEQQQQSLAEDKGNQKQPEIVMEQVKPSGEGSTPPPIDVGTVGINQQQPSQNDAGSEGVEGKVEEPRTNIQQQEKMVTESGVPTPSPLTAADLPPPLHVLDKIHEALAQESAAKVQPPAEQQQQQNSNSGELQKNARDASNKPPIITSTEDLVLKKVLSTQQSGPPPKPAQHQHASEQFAPEVAAKNNPIDEKIEKENTGIKLGEAEGLVVKRMAEQEQQPKQIQTPEPAAINFKSEEVPPPSVPPPIVNEALPPPLEMPKTSEINIDNLHHPPPPAPQPTPIVEEITVSPANIEETNQDGNKENSDMKMNYCFKDNCPDHIDKLPSDIHQQQQQTLSPSDSAVRKMFRKTMSSIRALLPEPLCYFEDTGLIVLAFLIISLVLHLVNTLFSKNSGPKPSDHRLLPDCLTRIKGQELIIEQMKVKMMENQRLAEIAKAAEGWQKEKITLVEKCQDAEMRASHLDAKSHSLDNELKKVKYERDHSNMVANELKLKLEEKEAEMKHIESEWNRCESQLAEFTTKLEQAEKREEHLKGDLQEARIQVERLKSELELKKQEADKWHNESEENKAQLHEVLLTIDDMANRNAMIAGRRSSSSKRGSSVEVEGQLFEKGKQQKTPTKSARVGAVKKEKTNGDNDSSSPDSSPGQLVDAAELDADNNGGGSGGSAGWSDLGDGTEVAGADEVVEHQTGRGENSPKVKSAQGPKRQTLAPSKKASENRTAREEREGKLEGTAEGEEEEEEGTAGTTTTIPKLIIEMAKLKGELSKLKTERDRLQYSEQVERVERKKLEEELIRLRQELVEKERESEQRELDRHGLTQQCTKLLQMIEEKEKKLENSEQERERLRSRMSEVELELRRVDDEKRELQHRVRELQQSLKQCEEQKADFENKLFHESRRWNNRVRLLEEQLSLTKSSISPLLNMTGGGMSSDLNMSANSSDRDFIPISSPDGAAAAGQTGAGEHRSGVPNLWSEIDAAEPIMEELVSLNRQADAALRRRRSHRGDGFGDVGGNGGGAGTDTMNSSFMSDLVHISNSGREERIAKSGSKYSLGAQSTKGTRVAGRAAEAPVPTSPRHHQRARSRSLGRQSARLTGVAMSAANPLYSSIGPSSTAASIYAAHQQYHRASVLPHRSSPFRQLPDRPHSAARLTAKGSFGTAVGVAASAAVAAAATYSSDSNEASSPPPEMPLLSGVPPPGIHKRPTVIAAPRLGVQLHRPAPK